MRPMKTSEEFVGQVKLRGKKRLQPVGRFAFAFRRRFSLIACLRLDAAIPPITDAHVAEAEQQAQAEIGAGAQTGGEGGARNTDPLTDGERFHLNRFVFEHRELTLAWSNRIDGLRRLA